MTAFDRAAGIARAATLISVLVLCSAQAADPASVARGAKAWGDNCDRCHEMRDPRDFHPDQWRVIVAHMRIRAGLTGQESRDVRAFLDQSSASTSVVRSPPIARAPVSAARNGKQIYEGTCIACHGADGKGALSAVPDLTAKRGPLSKSDSALLAHIEQGFQSAGSPLAMPPKGGNPSLTEADMRAVLGYIRNAFGG